VFSDTKQIFRAAVKLCGSMAELDKELNSATTSPIQGHALLTITRPETHYLVTFINGAMLGEVNALLEKALTNIMEQQYRLDFEVFAPIRAIRETISRATKEKDAVVRVQINVYGPQTNVAAIGREFSQHKIYLQRPDHVRGGTGYDNPHVLKLTDHQHPVPEIVVDVEEQVAERTAGDTLLKETIKDVYSSLTRNNHLRVLEGDERLKTPLLL
jgi:SWI/SNF-related matrix-associated actin-dependent regulator of chromatin subfamily A3